MLLVEFFNQPITEGGAVFPETVAIKKEYVPEIVKQVKKLLSGMNVHPDIGSAGYKIASGDMDVMIDAQELADKFGAADVKAAKKALQELLAKKSLETKLSGQNVHVKMPLPDGSFGQVDIMVIPDAKLVAPYHQHGPRGSYEDPDFKGQSIFILIASIAKSMNLKFEPFGAKLVKRDTGDLVARSRDDVARILLNPNATGDDLNSVKSIMSALEDDPKKDEKLAQARADAEKGLIKLPEAKEPNQLRGTDVAKTVKPRPFAGSQPHPFKGKLVGGESANPAQQAAIAIAKKKAGMSEDENPTDKVTMDVPLFIRMMEYAREDAKTDMDLHNVTERAIKLMQQHDYLCMDNYDDLIGGEATGGEKPVEEFKDTAKFGDDSGKDINHEIFLLLKSGATVYSSAAGRVGQIIGANNDGVTVKTKRGKGFTTFNRGDKVKIEKIEGKPNHYHVVNMMNEGWKDAAKVGAALGIAGGMGVAGKYADDHAQRVQIGNNQAYVVSNPGAGTIPLDAKIVKGADGKMYKVWIKGGEPRTGSTKSMFATPVSEEKIKGADGKACWDGYRYAGTENGKDKCVPVKKSK